MKRKCVICRGWIRSASKLRRLPLAARPSTHVGCLKRAVAFYAAEIRRQNEVIRKDVESVIANLRGFKNTRGKPWFVPSGGENRFGVKTGNVVTP